MKKIAVEMHHYQITSLITALFLLFVITFLTGYFWGKKSALEEFAEQIKNESFSDKVYASLCALYDQPQGEALVVEPVEEKEKPTALFVAQLIGYGTERQAQLYVNSLERKGIAAQIIKRTSATASGKKRIWYQVVTQPAPYDETQRLAERLAIEDRLAGVALVEAVNCA
jgi:hypothetical protein